MDITTLYRHFLNATGISTDTRNIHKGNLFFALRGPNFDANKLAKEALEKGATYAVIDNPDFQQENTILVDHALTTLQQLALHHRRQFNIPVIGLTGSNGKTTTKELIHAVLSQKYNTHYTKGNLNNHIGVPLTLLSMPSDCEIAVIEMGANKPGDIAELSALAEPTHGLITNIGRAHLEGFGGLEGVIRTKSELYTFLSEHEGVVFVNGDNELLMRQASRFSHIIQYLGEKPFYQASLASGHPEVSLRTDEGATVHTQMIGAYNFENIVAALCIGKYFEVPPQQRNQAIASYTSSNNRSQVIKRKNGQLIYLDAYNANPSSMAAAIENFDALGIENKAVILGDMFELGDYADKEHRDIIDKTLNYRLSHRLFTGKHFQQVRRKDDDALFFTDREELAQWLKKQEKSWDAVLIKGSRGIGLENVVELV